jgi:hypothetical protein
MLAAALSTGAAILRVWFGASPLLVVAPVTLLTCYALWARADLSLFACSAGAPASTQTS